MFRITRIRRCKRLSRNGAGRDFVVGDLHGHRGLFERELQRLGFDPARDRVLSVGDLVDRGPDSLATLSLIREPWFHAVLGNHEMMLLHFLQCYDSRRYARKAWASGPGAWIADAVARHPKRIERLRGALSELPLALHVEHELPFNVMHADRDPLGAPLARRTVNVHDAEALACSRANVTSLPREGLSTLSFGGRTVRLGERLLGAMPLTYVGHSPQAEVTVHNGHVYIDQGVGTVDAKRLQPRPPTVLEHQAFAYWLTGVSLAHGGQARADALLAA